MTLWRTATIVAAGVLGVGSVVAGGVSGPAAASPGGTTERVSVSGTGAQGNDHSVISATSGDGSVVTFLSAASNLVPGDTHSSELDVFVRDRRTGTTSRVNESSPGIPLDGISGAPAVSGNGRYIAFTFVDSPNDPPRPSGPTWEIVVHDRVSGTTDYATLTPTGARSDGNAFEPALSTDGRYLAFTSTGDDLVDHHLYRAQHLYVRDQATRTTSLVDVSTSGAESHGNAGSPALSANGRHVAFASAGSDLVAGDTNGLGDVFVRDRKTRVTERVSVSGTGQQAEGGEVGTVAISGNGRYVAFLSSATNLVPGDTNGTEDVFVRDRVAKTTERVSVGAEGRQADDYFQTLTMSADGRYVSFCSYSARLVRGDTNGATDMFVRDRRTRTTTRVSLASDGAQANGRSLGTISADGRWAVFESDAANLAAGDTNGRSDVFVRRLRP